MKNLISIIALLISLTACNAQTIDTTQGYVSYVFLLEEQVLNIQITEQANEDFTVNSFEDENVSNEYETTIIVNNEEITFTMDDGNKELTLENGFTFGIFFTMNTSGTLQIMVNNKMIDGTKI